MSSVTTPSRVRREYGIAMLALVAGAALLLAAAGRPWVTGLLSAPGPVAPAPVDLTGGDLTGLPSGIGWAALAGVAGLYAAKGAARRLIGLLIAAGGAIALHGVWAATRPEALLDAVTKSTSDMAGTVQAATEPEPSLLGPAMAVAGAALLVVVGLLAVLRAPAWPGMGTRYDRDAAPSANRSETPSDLWKSLDAGDDPTLDAPEGTGPERAVRKDGDGTAHAPPAERPAEPKEKP